VKLNKALDDGKSKACATVLRSPAAAFEALEHTTQLIGRNADAAVLDGEDDAALFPPAGQPHGVPGLGEADGVREQIVKHLTDARFIRHEFGHVVGHRDIDGEPRADGPFADTEDRRVDDRAHADRHQLQVHAAGIDGGKVENVVDDGEQGFRR